MRISDWISDVCSSDLAREQPVFLDHELPGTRLDHRLGLADHLFGADLDAVARTPARDHGLRLHLERFHRLDQIDLALDLQRNQRRPQLADDATEFLPLFALDTKSVVMRRGV